MRLPEIPSMVSSNGSMWTLFPTGIVWYLCTLTISPNLTRRLFLTTFPILILSSVNLPLSSGKQIHIVSFLFFPFNKTVSDLKIFNSSIFFWVNWITLASSLGPTPSSAISLWGAFLRSNIAVEKSFGFESDFCSGCFGGAGVPLFGLLLLFASFGPDFFIFLYILFFLNSFIYFFQLI